MAESDAPATFVVEMVPTPARFDEPEAFADVLPAHLAWVEHLFDTGVVLASGPILDEQTGEKNGHGVLILRAESLADAVALVDGDPQVRGGFKRPTVRPWLARFGRQLDR